MQLINKNMDGKNSKFEFPRKSTKSRVAFSNEFTYYFGLYEGQWEMIGEWHFVYDSPAKQFMRVTPTNAKFEKIALAIIIAKSQNYLEDPLDPKEEGIVRLEKIKSTSEQICIITDQLNTNWCINKSIDRTALKGPQTAYLVVNHVKINKHSKRIPTVIYSTHKYSDELKEIILNIRKRNFRTIGIEKEVGLYKLHYFVFDLLIKETNKVTNEEYWVSDRKNIQAGWFETFSEILFSKKYFGPKRMPKKLFEHINKYKSTPMY